MRYVEQPAGRAHGHMLGDDAGFVLNREQVTGEGNDLSAVLYVRFI